MAFPTTLDTLTNPASSDSQATVSHSSQHINANNAITALETKVGINGSAVNTTIDYKLSGVSTGDKAVSKTGSETLTNKTLTSPIINVGSDATGDMYYRNSGGTFTRLAAGADGTIISYSSGIPVATANPSAADSSYSAKGLIKFNTDAATSGVTVSSGVATINTGTSANQIVKLDASSKLPAVDGSQLTNLTNPLVCKTGTTTKDISTTSTTTIAHSLGKTPKFVRITTAYSSAGTWTGIACQTVGTYDGTNTKCIFTNYNSGAGGAAGSSVDTTNIIHHQQTATPDQNLATVSVDSTNITLTWTKTGTPTGTISILWEAYA